MTAGLTADDRVALRALVDGYAVAVDRRDVPAFLALFADDAVLATFEPDGRRRGAYHGIDELAAVPPALARYERTLHLVSTHLVEPAPGDDGAGARGTAYCVAHHHRPVAGGEDAGGRDGEDRGGGGDVDRVLHIRYDDTYARRGAGWRIRTREVHVVWAEERPLPPT